MKLIRISLFTILVVVLSAYAPAAKTTTLKVVERATTDAVGDTAPEGDSVGDTLGFANEVFDETNTNKIGTDNGFCVRTAVGAAWECAWTLTLSNGQITVQGPFLDAGDSTLAITGGTGAYSQARGSMTLHARNPAGSEYDFTYMIMK